MSDLSSIGPGSGSIGSLGSINRLTPLAGTTNGVSRLVDTEPAATRATDRVELSEYARFLNQLRQLPGLPKDRVSAIQQAIIDGSYETPDKLDIAMERLIDDLDG